MDLNTNKNVILNTNRNDVGAGPAMPFVIESPDNVPGKAVPKRHGPLSPMWETKVED